MRTTLIKKVICFETFLFAAKIAFVNALLSQIKICSKNSTLHFFAEQKKFHKEQTSYLT